jgi:predicted transcriptional regulator
MKQGTFDALESIAEETDSTVAELIRQAIDEFLDRRRNEQIPRGKEN